MRILDLDEGGWRFCGREARLRIGTHSTSLARMERNWVSVQTSVFSMAFLTSADEDTGREVV